MIRLLGLLGLIAIAVLFALQNLTPAIALVFLGVQTPALPLAWWVLGAIGLGSATTLTVSVLFGLSSFVTRQTVRSQVRRTVADGSAPNQRTARRPPEDDAAWQDWRGYDQTPNQPAPDPTRTPPSADPADDWEQPRSDDWDDGLGSRSDRPRSQPEAARSTRLGSDFEMPQTPKRTPRTGSVYSSSYRESEPPADPSQSVVDADYRVLVPPHRPFEPPPPPEDNADDWFDDSRENRDRRS
jgi:hypothetical protein